MDSIFEDRQHAGAILGRKLAALEGSSDTIVLALPRGGIPVGWVIARALHVPLDVCIVRKLGVPANPELAMGAVASGGVVVLNHGVISDYGIPARAVEREVALEREEIERRERLYRGSRPPADLAGKTVILADDGIATGSTVEAAIRAVRQQGAQRVIVAVGVAPRSTVWRLSHTAEIFTGVTAEVFGSVGEWYRDFHQLPDEEAREYLENTAPAGALTDEDPVQAPKETGILMR